MNDMTDQQIDELVRQAQPRTSAGGHEVDRLGLRRAEQDLLEEIMSTPVRPEAGSPYADHENQITSPHRDPDLSPDRIVELGDVRPLPVRPHRTRTRAVAGIAAAAAVLAAVAVPALVFTGKDSDQNNGKVEIQNPAARADLAPGDVPRVVLRDPAWKIDYVEDSRAYGGTQTFVSGNKRLEVRWSPAGQYQGAYDDRMDVSSPKPITALGQTGAMFTYSSDDYAAVFPVKAGAKTFFEFRGGVDQSTFTALLDKLEIVPEIEWETALPPSVVKPGDETQVAQEMLTGIPLPPGFDAASLPTGLANQYYQFGAIVTGAVTCGWLKEYRIAHAAQDETTMAKVDEAMSTSRNWAVLKKMEPEGAWPDEIWKYAAKVSDRQPISAEEITQGLSCSV